MKKKIFLLGFLIVLNFFSWSLLFYFKDDSLRVVFFDVGQGDAIFIKTPQNHHILIDGGPGSVLLEKLGKELPFFYNNIDLVILTHPHDDHVSGIIEILDHYDVKDIICTGVIGDSAISRKWSEIIQDRGYRPARAGQKIFASNFYINILYPTENLQQEAVKDLNAVSIISQLVFKNNYSFLFMGDAYKEQEKNLVLYEKEGSFFTLKSDVLKVGHHGSRTSTSEEFLEVVSPKVVVIMTGEDNRYGHPHKETLETLARLGVEVMRTDYNGDIVLEL